ncbi:hypothetical protein Aca07nite_41460 [Actinoplanes capillaceus]|uniref:Uncharacterized protein n=1 Tax=Actinoplanes campanulatus TaxID=113559 RepID=A0ABQ3WKV0_9ACTN|nr:hypothetical protein Aca07nite_41460 [Actinoplanes capillaceus]
MRLHVGDRDVRRGGGLGGGGYSEAGRYQDGGADEGCCSHEISSAGSGIWGGPSIAEENARTPISIDTYQGSGRPVWNYRTALRLAAWICS